MSGLSVLGSLEFTRFTSLPLRNAASSITMSPWRFSWRSPRRCRVLPRVRPQPVYVISPQAFAAGGLTRGKTLQRRLAAAKSARFAAGVCGWRLRYQLINSSTKLFSFSSYSFSLSLSSPPSPLSVLPIPFPSRSHTWLVYPRAGLWQLFFQQ